VNDDKRLIDGFPEDFWTAAYRPGIQEFAATTFAFRRESGFVRIAFGNAGPPVAESAKRTAVFTHAVTLTQEQALDLSRKLRDCIAGPIKPERS
jgi:hypothetical protein